MTDYTNIPETVWQPKKPIIGSLFLQMFNNIISVMTGGAGAPRMRYLVDNWKQSGSGNQVFALPDQYTGAKLYMKCADTGGIGVAVSTDGSTFGAISEIYPDAVGEDGIAFVDFQNGGYVANYGNINQKTGTIAGASTSVTHIRLSNLGSGDVAVIIHWNGGSV